jgi:4-hydroxy-2-oxoheptanedioate aldolase
MDLPHNRFKAALHAGRRQIGCWLSLADPTATEIAGTAGFDWLVIDGEHAPNDLRAMLAQLRALAPYPVHPVVRLPAGEFWMIKQALDIGAQTLLIPLVESAEQARALVGAMRYAPRGNRGMGGSGMRATRYGAIADYVQLVERELCLLVQVETRAGLEQLDAILGVEGVDGVFIGPADLSADMGFPGRIDAPEVRAAIADALRRIRAAGKAPGILATDPAWARACLDDGVQFLAVGMDASLLARALRQLAADFAADRIPASDRPAS